MYYIIGYYNPSVRIIDLVVLCVLILYINGGTYSLKSTPNYMIFFEAIDGNLEFLPYICWEEIVLFWCLAWGSNPGTSNEPTHYLLDYGDFIENTSILYIM